MTTTMTSISKTKQEAFSMFGIKRKSTIKEDHTFRNTQKENTASMQEFKSLFEHIEPFHNIQEFKDALMSENWATTENLGKFWVTFPNLDRRLYKRIEDGSIYNCINYVDKISSSIGNSFENRLVALYNTLKPTAFTESFQQTLLDLGMPYNEMASAWQLSESVSKCIVCEKDVLPYIKDRDDMQKVFGFQYLKVGIMDKSETLEYIDETMMNMGFYMNLRENGIDINDNNVIMNPTFIQFGDTSECPSQGVKLHISATNKADYMNLLNNILPDLVACGATFKVLRLDAFDHLYESETQAGKSITIYQTPSFRAYDFFWKHPELFEEKGYNVKGDECFSGRVYGRYGSYVGPTVTDPKTVDVYQDDRHRPYPEFMDKITISDFISGCEEMSQEKEFDGIENGEFENDEYEADEISIEA